MVYEGTRGPGRLTDDLLVKKERDVTCVGIKEVRHSRMRLLTDHLHNFPSIF